MNAEHCGRCGRVTETDLLPLASGHIGRLCAVCRACRKGRPYAKKSEYQNADGHATRGLEQCQINKAVS